MNSKHQTEASQFTDGRIQSELDQPADQANEGSALAERPNKTAGKRKTNALRELSVKLANLPDARLAALPLSERARHALIEYQRIRPSAHGGRRRQMQWVIKLLRDENTEALVAMLDSEGQRDQVDSLERQRLIDMRTNLLESDDSLEEFIAQHRMDKEFRTLAYKARREVRAGAKPQAQRALLRALQKVFSKDTTTNDDSHPTEE